MVSAVFQATSAEDLHVLKPDAFAHHIARFNAMEDENRTNFISNAESWNWLRANIPFFECPDREVEEIYYFRWWSLRKHIRKTPQGFVFTEFLIKTNPISSALGHHINEARWLRDPRWLDDYVRYWLCGHDGAPQPHLHKYSGWLAHALWRRCLVTGDAKFAVALLDDLVRDYEQWESERRLPGGLFWQHDVRDAMEESISGSRTNQNIRPTINSYMFGNAQAIASIARRAGKTELAQRFDAKAAELKRLTQETLWSADAKFFEVRSEDGKFSDAREEIGFIPWMFELPDAGKGYEAAWAQLMDADGFRAPYGITTAERRHPQFRSHGCCNCEWDGAVWPYATSQTLTALANVLRDYPQSVVTPRDYFDCFLTYVRSHRFNGRPYIGEYLDETTGAWLKGAQERSRYYNHSTFADLVITGIAGLRPRADDTVEIHPLLPDGTWEWFCLDGVKYHGRTLTILWDRAGARYGKGAGLRVFADGKLIAETNQLAHVTGKLKSQ
ncbi:MAG: glycoside hydrolase [Verrucomicrobia bacterium]|nr:glycoside hydrolase [Verrucomicrobiota bacterium]